ncbi:hypothetical protein POVWA1_039030 [Plasmodium ovale wallikeri]|uniref:Uncharacterized protein n=1 Tax=Plasmodium ovale wallikeri TaxID=864142 RepID=A0A1A8Z4Y5_PLAOA|nr:hypothetical protein POVWA1_039030 [Plasmodium ovale wallikeri]
MGNLWGGRRKVEVMLQRTHTASSALPFPFQRSLYLKTSTRKKVKKRKHACVHGTVTSTCVACTQGAQPKNAQR